MSARLKLLVPLVLLVLLSATFLFGYWMPSYERDARARATEVQTAYLRALAPVLVDPLLTGQLSSVYETLDAQRPLHPHWTRLVLTADSKTRLYPLTLPPPDARQGLLTLREAVTHAGLHIADLELTVDVDALVREEIDKARRLGLAMLIALAVVTVLTAILQDRLVRHPLRLLAIAAGEMRRGNFDARLPAAGQDEIGELVTAFDSMRGSIEHYQKQLRHDAAHMRAVLDNIVDGILTLNVHGTVQSANPAAATIFGIPPWALLGRGLGSLLAEPYASRYTDHLRRYNEEGELEFLGTVHEVEALRADGSRFPLDIAIGAMATEGREFFTAVVRDITERRAVERLQREFVSTVSHELRTPLTSIRGSLGLLAGGALGQLSGDTQGLIEIAVNNTERLIRLINDILDIEKIESGRLTLSLQPVELMGLVNAAMSSQQGLAEYHAVRFHVTEHVPAVWIAADPDRLTQVLLNLLSNAAKYSPQGATVEVAVRDLGEAARVEVTDHGPGVPESFRERIFAPFARADSSDTRIKGGTGLGLAISKTLVERMGGVIGYHSEPNVRTTFHVELPSLDAPPADNVDERETGTV